MGGVLESFDVLENYLGRSADPSAAQQEIKGWLKAKIAAGHWDILAETIPRFIIPGLDYTSAFSLHRVLKQVSQNVRLHERETRIAVLGSFTTDQLVSLLELYLSAGRVKALVYQAEYGTFRQEVLDPE